MALTKVTVNLTPRSTEALDELATLTGYSKTDIINRALQMYELTETVMKFGGSVYVQKADGEVERLRIL